MTYHKNKFLKQWFTFTYSNDNSENLIYSCTNNHYIHGWFEEHGYSSFRNYLSKYDLDLFINDLNESGNLASDDFSDYFPDSYILSYSLWDMETASYWKNIKHYRAHAKHQTGILVDKLFEIQQSIEHGWSGVLEYHIYYHH